MEEDLINNVDELVDFGLLSKKDGQELKILIELKGGIKE